MTSNSSNTNNSQKSVDFKYYIYLVFSYWQLFLTAIIISLIFSRFMTGYTQRMYSLSTMISIKEENNPLFSTGTNLTFNWGWS